MLINLEKSPVQVFQKRLAQIKLIQHIQKDLKASDVARLTKKIQFLNQSYVVHLVASWQEFVEELGKVCKTPLPTGSWREAQARWRP